MDTFDVNLHFRKYKLENIHKLFAIAFFLYILIAFIDYSLAKKDFLLFFFNRLAFVLPYTVLYFANHKLNPNKVDLYGLIIFTGLAGGASTASYMLGGLKSDYYFGVVVISFAQFITMPLRPSKTIVMELIFIFIYFPLNYFAFDYPPELLSKQVSNYLSFALIKIAVSGRFRYQIIESFKSMELNRKLEKKETVQIVLGELCHLLNNPLFISTSLIKRLKKKEDLKDDKDLNKAIEANDRMKEILHEMLKVQAQEELTFEDNQVLKDFFKDKDIETKQTKQ